jgi:hypothetical protein
MPECWLSRVSTLMKMTSKYDCAAGGDEAVADAQIG